MNRPAADGVKKIALLGRAGHRLDRQPVTTVISSSCIEIEHGSISVMPVGSTPYCVMALEKVSPLGRGA